MKLLKWLGLFAFILIILYFMGPHPSAPKYTKELPVIEVPLKQMDSFIKTQEAKFKIKPDNEARIIWANDSLKEMTEYAVVYLHGFSASQEEGDPLHYAFAQKFGCNLYLSRLDAHGLVTGEQLLDMTAEGLYNTAKQAYAIGKKLGKKVILMSTSTGGTLALKLASEFPEIAGLILLSPNIEINDSKAWLLNNPWGLQISRLFKGRYNVVSDTTAIYAQYWNNRYRMEATVQLEELLETTMKHSVFKKVTQPLLLLYYYKDEEHQDPVVKVSAMKRMFTQVSTPENLKRQIAIPNGGAHVLGSYIKSQDLASVETACDSFAIEILKMKLVNAR